MNKEINLEDLVFRASCFPGEEYVGMFMEEEDYSYIRPVRIDLAVESSGGDDVVMVLGDKENVDKLGRINGALILGHQAYADGEDIIAICDECSADLFVMANNLSDDDVLLDWDDETRDVFYIDTIELTSEVVDADNLDRLIELIPRIVFYCTNVMPDVCCYAIATAEGYYEKQARNTKYDPRSVDEHSISMFENSGYRKSRIGELLYRVYDEEDLLFENEDECEYGDAVKFGEDHKSLGDFAGDTEFEIASLDADADRALQEDHISIQYGKDIVLVPSSMPDGLYRYIQAAMAAYNFRTGIDFTLRRYFSDAAPSIPAIHRRFQKMYFAGKQHMEDTMMRMHPVEEPTHGELYAEAALARARNTYYVAAWLYREGHLIEAHAMSRLMLEQIAWAYSVCDVKNIDEGKEKSPTKAITQLKKLIPPVGRMYKALSDYVHLPLRGHYEFIDLKSGESAVLFQFGEYSYASGKVISYLADYWTVVYEYTQSRHFNKLENLIEDDSGLALNPKRPFLKVIQPLRAELERTYIDKNGPFAAFIEENWNVDSSNGM